MSSADNRVAMTPGIVLEGLLGSHSGPKLRPLLPVSSSTLTAVAEAGYRFVQYGPLVRTSPSRCTSHGLRSVASVTWHFAPGDRDLSASLRSAADAGFEFASVLVGTGLTHRDDAAARVEELLRTSEDADMPVCLETHRATITESVRETLWLAQRFPSLRFNLDLSHWFVTHRLDRVNPSEFVEFTRPLLSRCRLAHGRVSSNEEIQVEVEHESSAFFRTVWAEVATASPDCWFAPELLPAWMGYGRDDHEVDRWSDASVLREWVASV